MNRLLILISFIFCFSSIFAGGKEEIKQMPQFEDIEAMLQFAKKQIHKPYRTGGEGPNSFDCSGFTRFCYKKLGITLNRTSRDQTKNGKKIRFRRHLKEGDLVFFRGSKGWKVGHVGIVISKGKGKSFQFIHASPSSGIVIENSDVKYFKKRYKKARRITSDRDIRKAIKAFKKELKSEEILDDVYLKGDENNNSVINKTHIVDKGDTLYNIAKRYGCSVEDLKKWNNMKDNNIKLGQVLYIKN